VKILVIGSGAREHAIVNALLRDTTAHEIVVAPGNAGIADVVETVSLNTTDGSLIATFGSSFVPLITAGEFPNAIQFFPQ
jgi:phosphoribosylamine--glycine ligase